MHFDVIEAVKQKQHKQLRSISIENGKVVTISITNGKVIVCPGVLNSEVPQGLTRDEETESSEIVILDD